MNSPKDREPTTSLSIEHERQINANRGGLSPSRQDRSERRALVRRVAQRDVMSLRSEKLSSRQIQTLAELCLDPSDVSCSLILVIATGRQRQRRALRRAGPGHPVRSASESARAARPRGAVGRPRCRSCVGARPLASTSAATRSSSTTRILMANPRRALTNAAPRAHAHQGFSVHVRRPNAPGCCLPPPSLIRCTASLVAKVTPSPCGSPIPATETRPASRQLPANRSAAR